MPMRLRIKELIREKSEREGRNITQREVSEGSGVEQSMLSRYANGLPGSFNGDTIERLLDYFEVNIDELFCREADQATAEPQPLFKWRERD
jgi:transcriptional regulator with XRE-family HTH domain